jgi:hypothetical protein
MIDGSTRLSRPNREAEKDKKNKNEKRLGARLAEIEDYLEDKYTGLSWLETGKTELRCYIRWLRGA